jgi:hypothetical protein
MRILLSLATVVILLTGCMTTPSKQIAILDKSVNEGQRLWGRHYQRGKCSIEQVKDSEHLLDMYYQQRTLCLRLSANLEGGQMQQNIGGLCCRALDYLAYTQNRMDYPFNSDWTVKNVLKICYTYDR